MVFDIFSSLPYTFIFENISIQTNITSEAGGSQITEEDVKKGKALRLLRLMKFIKIIRLLKMVKLKSVLNKVFHILFINQNLLG